MDPGRFQPPTLGLLTATLSVTFPAGAEAAAAERGEAELERWRAGLREDLEFATQPRFCYSHEW